MNEIQFSGGILIFTIFAAGALFFRFNSICENYALELAHFVSKASKFVSFSFENCGPLAKFGKEHKGFCDGLKLTTSQKFL